MATEPRPSRSSVRAAITASPSGRYLACAPVLLDEPDDDVEVVVHQLERDRVADRGVELGRGRQVAEEEAGARDLEGHARAEDVGGEVAAEAGHRREHAGRAAWSAHVRCSESLACRSSGAWFSTRGSRGAIVGASAATASPEKRGSTRARRPSRPPGRRRRRARRAGSAPRRGGQAGLCLAVGRGGWPGRPRAACVRGRRYGRGRCRPRGRRWAGAKVASTAASARVEGELQVAELAGAVIERASGG